jgi:uncharacterized protein DUF998
MTTMRDGPLNARRLALLGSIGPALFVVIVIVLTKLEWDFLHRLGWHLVQDSSVPYPSSTAMGPYGWLQTLNFIQVGLSVIAIALGVWRSVRPRPRVGAGFLFLAGVAILLSMFTTDGTTNQPTTWHGWIHSSAFILLLFSTLLGTLTMAFQLRNTPGWRGVALASAAVPVVIIGTLFLGGAVKQAGGLIGLLSLLAIFAWFELLGLRLLTLSADRLVLATGPSSG